MQKGIVEMQRKMAGFGGVTLLQTIRTKSAGGAQNDKMAKARAQLENMIQQGGPGAAGAQQALARMSAQMPIEEKIKLANYVIDTSGTLKHTLDLVESIYQKLRDCDLHKQVHELR